MKPIELSLTGFRSYPSPATVDFTGRNLAAAVGDTGAGKSSLLDAITYALFRKSSWDAKEPRQLIADRAQAMSVSLTFLHNGHRWRVDRTMHATNANAGRHHLTNLDTGEEVDSAGAVDARIKAVLQMGYDTFLRVGLLPQGKFDQLLTAAAKERTARLRELFGADALETIREGAVLRHSSLSGLLAEAKGKRSGMPEDPAGAAEVAGAAAKAAEERVERLDSAIETVSALQKLVSEATAAAAAADNAARFLAEKAVPDAESVLDALEPVAADISARRGLLNSRATAAAARDGVLTSQIEEIEDRGEGHDELVTAAAVVAKLPGQAGEHRAERDRLVAEKAELAAETKAITAVAADVTQRTELAKPLTKASEAAVDVSKRLQAKGVDVRTHLAEATAAAQQVARTALAHRTAVSAVDLAQQAVAPLDEEVRGAEAEVEAAEQHLDALKLRDRAASVAAELHAGDDCPVCRRALPAGFEPAAGAGEADLSAAKELVRKARVNAKSADRALADARGAVTTAETAASGHAKDHRKAEENLQRATEKVLKVHVEFASLAVEAEESFDAQAASAMLTEATTALATHSDDSTLDPSKLVEPVSAALARCEHAAATRADRLRTEAIEATAALDVERKALSGRKEIHAKAVKTAKAASVRHSRAVDRMTEDIDALPARIRQVLPGKAIDVGAEVAAEVAGTIAAGLAEIKDLLAEQKSVRTEQNTVLKLQRALDQEAGKAVDEPLTRLRHRLDGWADAAVQAAAQLPDADGNRLPEAPAEPGITEIRTFATALSAVTGALRSELTKVGAAHSVRAAEAAAGLRAQAAVLTDVEGVDPACCLTDSSHLHPLVAARAKAETEAANQRKLQGRAQDLVKPAADLDFAIRAGQARLAALDVLRRELVEAKFLGHLTGLNTRALLGIASDLLGQLTDLRFGFAGSFEIVSRNSGVVHAANRLSGGEKFLASLALALAPYFAHGGRWGDRGFRS
ncbi:AAA family ATPase [Amycolatopsis panacis]|uniref:Nuclease SbcCD subunit C n=1 Tax=Amycolatopsis panacis TaxID=2340917 RepID=A0A419HJI1_9PSEU|nr:SMC family ATPase [Amycolatopsis panacis]RJQ75955.1 SMC family ATPase [Amycolatopsis panacis]